MQDPKPKKRSWHRHILIAGLGLWALSLIADWTFVYYRVRLDMASKEGRHELAGSALAKEPRRYRGLIVDCLMVSAKEGDIYFLNIFVSLMRDRPDLRSEYIEALAMRYREDRKRWQQMNSLLISWGKLGSNRTEMDLLISIQRRAAALSGVLSRFEEQK